MELKFFSSDENEFSLFGMSSELFFARPLKSIGKLFTKEPFTTNLRTFLLEYAKTSPDLMNAVNVVMTTIASFLSAYGTGVQVYGIIKNIVVPVVEKVKGTIQSVTLPPPVGAASKVATEAKAITETIAEEAKAQSGVIITQAMKSVLEKPITIPDLPSIEQVTPPEVMAQIDSFMSQYTANFDIVNQTVDNILNVMQSLPKIPK